MFPPKLGGAARHRLLSGFPGGVPLMTANSFLQFTTERWAATTTAPVAMANH